MAVGREDSLVQAKIRHQRRTPQQNGFLYHQNYVLLEASAHWSSSLSFFSLNRFNLFSLFYKKYGLRNGDNPYDYAQQLLKEHCACPDWLDKILLFTQPALLGWCFNPVSFWFYLDMEGNLRAVLVEVNNTFGENHQYFAFLNQFHPIPPDQKLKGEKVFYVSPFLTVEGTYHFRFKLTPKSVAVWIDYFREEKLIMTTSIVGKRNKLTDTRLVKAFFKNPVAMIKTPFLIHWQALKIWLKGVKYVKRHPHNNSEVTKCR